ncbi:MAG TPA: DAK2 domain-containing protein, partial [Chloroflexota bacterium]|nr:DAK2 domain-containing protein [Chloroflexota bacterium]
MRNPKGIRSNASQSPPAGSTPESPVEQVARQAPLGASPIAGSEIIRLIESGTSLLEQNVAAVDALNVFPVPDGDTGTNMLLTMRSALEGASTAKSHEAGETLRAIARGAVMGARGNSGVILSQIIAGYARGLEGTTTLDSRHLAQALMEGATTAYRAVTRPVEGTILTVARAAGEGAVAAIDANPDSTAAQVLDAA